MEIMDTIPGPLDLPEAAPARLRPSGVAAGSGRLRLARPRRRLATHRALRVVLGEAARRRLQRPAQRVVESGPPPVQTRRLVRGKPSAHADVPVHQPALDRHATALADPVAEGTARDAGWRFVLVLVHCVPHYPYRSEELLHRPTDRRERAPDAGLAIAMRDREHSGRDTPSCSWCLIATRHPAALRRPEGRGVAGDGGCLVRSAGLGGRCRSPAAPPLAVLASGEGRATCSPRIEVPNPPLIRQPTSPRTRCCVVKCTSARTRASCSAPCSPPKTVESTSASALWSWRTRSYAGAARRRPRSATTCWSDRTRTSTAPSSRTARSSPPELPRFPAPLLGRAAKSASMPSFTSTRSSPRVPQCPSGGSPRATPPCSSRRIAMKSCGQSNKGSTSRARFTVFRAMPPPTSA